MKEQSVNTSDHKLLLFSCLLLGASLFSTIHSLIYNWIFLHRLFQVEERPFFINWHILRSYWDWPAGKILIIINALLIVLPFIMLSVQIKRNRTGNQ